MPPSKRKPGSTPAKPRSTGAKGGRKPRAAPEADARVAEGEIVDAEAVEVSDAEPAEPGDDAIEDIDDAEWSEVPAKPGAIVRASSSEKGLAARKDPLQAYMDEVTRHKLLTREEEHALAVKYRETEDVKAAYRLVASNLRLVVKLAHEYHRNPLALLDLIQEGNIGLMQAVKKYDPYRGVKLSSYAAWWIRAYILRYIMDNWKMVKLGTTEAQRKLFFKLRQEQDRLTAQGFEVTPKLLADRLNVTEQDVVEMDQRLGQDELSLDAPMREDSSATRADRMLPSGQIGADEELGNRELRALFREKLEDFSETLTEKERYIYEKRLISEEPQTLQQVGENFGVSRERARQLEAVLISRIREYLREEIPDFDLVANPKT